MSEIAHGTASGYTNGKCRCDPCREAHRQAAAAYRASGGATTINAARRRAYAANPDKVLEQNRAWARANPDKVKEYERTKRERHADAIRERDRVYYLLNRQRIIDRATQWKRDHPEETRAHGRLAHERHREERNAYAREYARRMRSEQPELLRARFAAWAASPRGRAWFAGNRSRRRGVPYTPEALEWLESLVDPECTYCGQPADSIDHIVPVSKGGTGDRDNLTPACMTCNRRKGSLDRDTFLMRLEATIDQARD